ncbi:hypothetical protein [Halomonas sp. SpR8]|uniref:hypothetical protein n=1 Tax=Halomonas sp. SpR8 TaxID=3050463 RepID=UPI0027E3CACA|nr:hypothetical protein [Halomonas sp. SpR8]MDQ7728332.1 hypothetical protein [Halomonas sp. SpR8]
MIGLAALSYWIAGGLTLLATLALGAAIGWHACTRQPRGVLSLTATGSLFQGRWLMPDGVLSEELQVRCDYLGPWLIGLYVGKQRIWLWPDSASTQHLREVRKLFHQPGH